ncbi:hypothetical protein BaRGS_00010172 [Batillaria attramentaria]|uniref:Uncharacterized protein n=1 Tax=Batillaria attramentaria TaxID=370345 RepID=A0ABD0LG98_9CAEN
MKSRSDRRWSSWLSECTLSSFFFGRDFQDSKALTNLLSSYSLPVVNTALVVARWTVQVCCAHTIFLQVIFRPPVASKGSPVAISKRLQPQ